jgi:hypothetical protein
MDVRVTSGKSTGNRAVYVRAIIETGFIIGGLLANLLLIPHQLSGDALLRFKELSQLLSAYTLSASRFSLVGPLFASPLWFLGKVYQTSEWWCLRYNTVLLALGMATFYLLLRNRLDRSLLRIFLILLVFASMLTQQLTDFDGEIFTALMVLLGATLVVQRRGKIGWPMIVIGVINAPASLVGLGLLTLTRIWSTRHLRYFVVPVVAAGLVGAEDWIRRGNPLDSGYHGFNGNVGFRTVMPYSGLPGFSYPIFFGLLSILFSFGKGLVFYMPGLFLPVRRRLLSLGKAGRDMYATYQLWMVFLIGLVLVYSHWWAWYGGWYWGPRFFLFGSIIACFALALIVRRPSDSLVANLVYLGALVLSFWVGIDGVLFGQNTLSQVCDANNLALLEAFCHYVPEFSALWRPFVVYEPLAPQQIAYLAFSVIVCVYVALPLLQRLALQVRAQFARLRLVYARQAWHF